MQKSDKKKKVLAILAAVLANALLLPGCTTTTANQVPATDTTNYASIAGSNTQKGLGLMQNFTMNSYYWVAITTIDGQRQPSLLLSPGQHTIGVQCMANSNPDMTDYSTVTLVAKPKAKYQVVLNLPNPTDFYTHPCAYAVVKEAD